MLLGEDDFWSNGSRGDWCFSDTTDGLYIYIWYSDDDMTAVPIVDGAANQRRWAWNGNKEYPTISPSILMRDFKGNTIWHGFFTDGKLITV